MLANIHILIIMAEFRFSRNKIYTVDWWFLVHMSWSMTVYNIS